MSRTEKNISRRRFVGHSAMLGTGIGLMNTDSLAASDTSGKILKNRREDVDYSLNKPENIIYSSCLNCNTGCGIKCKIQDGVLSKIDGNPFNPWNMVPHLSMHVSLSDAAAVDAGLCPKGQAGVQIAYDPYRLRKVLKRAGKRGENRWITIPFDQAVREIVNGGYIFSHVQGEEMREVQGLKSVMTLTDRQLANEMGLKINTLLYEADPGRKQQLVKDFKKEFAEHLDKLIDPEHPDMGPKNNQFVIAWGRLKNGRKEFISRFGEAFGTVNLHGHTTVCQGSLYFTCKAISEQYRMGKFSGGQKFYWQAELEHARYVLFVGANLFEANYGPTNRTVRLTENLSRGFTKIAVADPRYSKLASKAQTWLPIKPGEDSALAMAIIKWIINNERYDKTFLTTANKAAATVNGESSWTNATWLVEINDNIPGKFLRASDLGLCKAEKRTGKNPSDKNATVLYEEKFMVVMAGGRPVKFDPNDTVQPVSGDLFSDETLVLPDGSTRRVKSSLQLLREEADRYTLEEWCSIAGLETKDVVKVAKELTNYGKQAAVEIHRGVAQHTSGFYSVLAWMTVNMLLGNFDWNGGMAKATTYNYKGSSDGAFDLTVNPGKISSFGISAIRHDIDYEKTTLFKGYPAQRNWYPLSSDVYQEIIPSIGEGYPYPVKILFTYMGAPAYALPAGHTNIEILSDINRLPLYFASDILIGTTSMYADYIFPDLSYLERWEFQGSHPNMPNKIENIRQPVIAPVPETVTVNGEEMPISLEALMMSISEEMGLKAFGKNALGEGIHIDKPEDFYLRGVVNIALDDKPVEIVPEDAQAEEKIFVQARRHLPSSVFNASRWKEITGPDNWLKVMFLLNRGGRFEEHSETFEQKMLAHKYGSLLNMYQEKTASKKYSGTGRPYPGLAKYIPQRKYSGENLDDLAEGFDLHLITSRTVTHTKTRTVAAYWLHGIMPENHIIINSLDANALGLKNGDETLITSSTNPEGIWDLKNGHRKKIVGKIKTTEAIRPGTVNFYLGYGLWATGADNVVIDGTIIKGDPRRATGFNANAVMWTDKSLKSNTCLIDPVGGSVSFYDTMIKLIKV